MKKIFFSIVALAALAACTKSEVAYESSAEIGFAPAVKNVTKAAMEEGPLEDENVQLGVWAYWNNDGSIEAEATYANYETLYLADALFGLKDNAWGGVNESYPWPTNGSLVFAGYIKPQGESLSVTYGLTDNTVTTDATDPDCMIFTDYTQSSNPAETFDLCWFGRTLGSYNNYKTGTAVPVTLSHALTWITFQIVGEEGSLPVTSNWVVTKVTLNDIYTTGTGKCVGTTVKEGDTVTPAVATWDNLEDDTSMDIFEAREANPENDIVALDAQVIDDEAADIEETPRGTIIIPQDPTSVTIEYQYTVQGRPIVESKTLPLTLSDSGKWRAGVHYTYTLVFNSNEILVSPSYADWATSDQTVTVE